MDLDAGNAAGNARPCPHCGDLLSTRQIGRHLAQRRRELGQYVAALMQDEDEVNDDDDDEGDEGDGDDRSDGERPPDGLEPLAEDLGGPAIGMEGVENADDPEILGSVANMSLADDEERVLAPPPELQRAQGLRRNPPVAIEDWPDPEDDNYAGSEDDEGPINDADRDPEFIERDPLAGFGPEDEPALDDEQLRAFLEAQIGDLADEEWLDMYARDLSRRDHTTLQFLASRLRTHFSRQTYDDLRHGAFEPLNIPSEFVAWRRLRILSGLETHAYDCCVNSCCCFLGKYRDMAVCPFCQEPRRNGVGEARRSFHYSPLIPQLQGLFQNADSINNMHYRAQAEDLHEPDNFFDIFDGENYRSLRNTQVNEGNDYRFFDSRDDVALALSTDGFTLFKRRRRGLSTAWPIMLVNLNLSPRIRTRLENILCVGVIPGPKQCKDLNSFLIPLLEELLSLADGVESSKVASDADDDNNDGEAGGHGENEGSYFVLRAFIILIFGDIPAVSKLLAMKGHNAITPCRACFIRGVLCRLARNSVYYVPLTAPGDAQPFPADDLLMRTHASFFQYFAQLDAATTNVERARVAQDCGINSASIFARLKSIDLANCAPYDIMHLLFENLVPNMIRHWTGNFKGMDEGNGDYQLSQRDWADIGRLTSKAARTIPAAFVGTLPNIAEDGNLYKAEAYSFWFTYIAPIVLKDRLPGVYYRHYLRMREIFLWCLELEITSDQVDGLQIMVNQWVGDYERLYYQYQQKRLPACPLTIHALLHMPHYIRRTGPLWTSWAFVMERFCGHLLPAVKNRVRPYEHLDNYVQRRAQMQIVSRVYNMPSLAKPKVNYTYQAGERLSSHERMHPEFPNIILGVPIKSVEHVDDPLYRQFTKYFGVVYHPLGGQELRARIDMTTLISYGRFRLADDGDRIRTADLIAHDPSARDNSFIRYELLPDANAARRNLPDIPIRVAHYGQVINVYYVEFVENPGTNARKPYLLVQVQECNTRGADAALPQSPVVTYNRMQTPDIIHINTVEAVVGRIQLNRNTWGIIDRSRNGARTQFIDEEGNDFD